MKTYKHVYDICISRENREISAIELYKSKRIKKIIANKNYIKNDIIDKSLYWITNYNTVHHTPVYIKDNSSKKIRKIEVPTLQELSVQYNIVNALKPLFMTGMYEHSYASIPGKGAHKGKKVIEKWIKKDKINTKYILKIDIKHFFENISQEILFNKFKTYIKDEKMLSLLKKVILTSEKGIPLGFYTSQWFSNWYLQDLDHYIKEILHVKYYIRYMDDMVLFGCSKKKLHNDKKRIEIYLKKYLNLELKSNWQVFLFDWNGKGRDLNFMGFRFFRNRTLLRKSILYKASRKANKIYKKQKITSYDAMQMSSYLGWFKATDTYYIFNNRILTKVKIGVLSDIISKHNYNDPKNMYYRLVKLYN